MNYTDAVEKEYYKQLYREEKETNNLFVDKCNELQKENNMLTDSVKDLKCKLTAKKTDFNDMCDKYRELEKKHEDLQKRQNACADTWVKCEERNDELKGTLDAKNEEIERLREKVANQKTQLIETQQALANKNIQIEKLKDDNKKLLRFMTSPCVGLADAFMDNEVTKYENEIKALKDEIEVLKDALHDDEVEIHKLKEERDYYVADIDLYEKDVTELRAKVKCLEGDISSANKRVEAYKNDYYRVLNAYNDRIEELNCEVDRLTKLEAENAVQKAQIRIDNMYMTYYANGPIWTNEEDEDDISRSASEN